jgi:hypothetical protein
VPPLLGDDAGGLLPALAAMADSSGQIGIGEGDVGDDAFAKEGGDALPGAIVKLVRE